MGANYSFLAPLFPQNSKTVTDFKPTLAGTFIWALYGFDKDLKFQSWDHSKSWTSSKGTFQSI